jgi:hypothetical protein
MKRLLGSILAFGLALIACGGEQHAHDEHGHHHEEMKGPLGELHAVLAPIWHGEKGPGRVAKACEQAKTMRDRSAAAQAAPPPPKAPAEKYKAAAQELTAAGDALVAACAASGQPEAEAKFVAFHDAFHKAAELGGGEHHH